MKRFTFLCLYVRSETVRLVYITLTKDSLNERGIVMKIKKEFTVRDLYGEDVLVPVGETAKSFKGIIKMNNIGRFIWENLEKVETEDEIVSMVIDKYALELTQAKNDVDDFIKYLKNVDII